MRDMVMQMTGSNGLLSVPDEHLPGLIVLVLIGPLVWLAVSGLRALDAHGVPWAQRAQGRLDAVGFAGRVALFGCLVGALVHAAIVPTHWGDERVTAILFMVDTAAFALAFWWTFMARPAWRLVAAAILGGTACVYAFYVLKGWETMDPVGLLTTTIEAAAGLVALSPAVSSVRAYGVTLAAAAVAMFSLIGTSVLASASQFHVHVHVHAHRHGQRVDGTVARPNERFVEWRQGGDVDAGVPGQGDAALLAHHLTGR